MSARRILSGLVAVLLAACTADPLPTSTPAPASSPAATASPSAPPIPFASGALRREVTRSHLRAILIDLQAVADEERGNRAAGTPGYEGSVGVVSGHLRELGLRVRRQRFTMPVFSPLGPAVISGPGIAPLRDGRDFRAVLYSGSGDVSGPLHEVGPAGAAGCDEGDFGSLPRGGVALAVSGGCSTATKVTNAQAAGAAALLIERRDALPGMPLRPATFSVSGIAIPAVALTSPAADAVRSAGAEVRVAVFARITEEATSNVVAEIGPRTGPVVMLGAHLDSVIDGPGLNDNGSGVAALVAVARSLSRVAPGRRPRVRFGFWGGEEYGLYGSSAYVRSLDASAREVVTAYVNADMLGSRNGFRRVYSAAGEPAGSQDVADALGAGLTVQGLEFGLETEISGRSDHGPFADAGIPVGGVYTGGNELVGEEEAARDGATAGVPADRCYHQPCDTFGGVNLRLLEQMADALAHAVTVLAIRS